MNLRTTSNRLDVLPLVAPSGQFVFSPLAGNVSDGLTIEGTISKRAVTLGYKTIEEVADNPKQAAALIEGLRHGYMLKRGAGVPESLMPKKVLEMRKMKKVERVPFGGVASKGEK